tara:strand:+ start:277 stop:450 length:174 start_codon:yes stop_codon:yes gene_type:complete
MKSRLRQIYRLTCGVAFLTNIGLFGFACFLENNELQILSIVNMIFLSFILLGDTNQK